MSAQPRSGAIALAHPQRGFARAIRIGVAALSAGAAAIHFAVVGEHLKEYVLFGVFFGALGIAQAVWAGLIVVRPSRWMYVAGLIANAGVVLIWLVSRTTGLPIGPEAGSPEPARVLDVLSTSYEVLIVVGIVFLLVPGRLRRQASVRLAGALPWVVALTVVALTAASLAASG